MLEDMKLYELFVKEDVGKQINFKDLQEWARAKLKQLDSVPVAGRDAVLLYATISTFLKENFLVGDAEERHNVITRPA